VRRCQLATIKALLNAGADVSCCDEAGCNLLHLAASAKHAEVMALLLNLARRRVRPTVHHEMIVKAQPTFGDPLSLAKDERAAVTLSARALIAKGQTWLDPSDPQAEYNVQDWRVTYHDIKG